MQATNLAITADRPNDIAPAWWAVMSRFLLHGLVLSTWASRIPAIQTLLGLSNAELGVCLLGTATGSVISIPVTSRLIARFGSKRVTAWSTVGLALMLVAPAVAFNSWTLFAGLILLGAMAGANDVSINAQGVAVEKAMGSPTMSRFHAMFSIGGMMGATIGAVIASRSIEPRIHFVAASLLFCAAGLFTSPLLLDANDDRRRLTHLVRLGALPHVVFTLAVIGFCMFLSEGAIADWTGVYLKQVLNADQGMAAAGYAVFSCGMALFRLVGDSVTKRLGPVRTLRLGAASAISGLTLALTAPSSRIALPGFALTGAGFSVIVPLVFAAGGRASSAAPGTGIALISGFGYIGFLFGPPLIGLIAEGSSLRIALCLLVALSSVAAMLAPAVRGQNT